MPRVEEGFNREPEPVWNPSTEESNVQEIENSLKIVEREQNAKVQC